MLHVFGAIMTAQAVASNNRGENEGNLATLRKILWTGPDGTTETYSSVSAEAIRFALRRDMELSDPGSCDRVYDSETRVNNWRGEGQFDPIKYADDDVFGFMHAKAGKNEETTPTSEDDEAVAAPEPVKGGKGKNGTTVRAKAAKGTTTVRRSVLEVSPAVSTTPWHGDVLFNVASPGATGDAAPGKVVNPKPYSVETHSTSYQYGFAMTPLSLKVPMRAETVLDRIADLGPVAGNHARFNFSFAPESVVLRVTDDMSPRILYPFVITADGRVTIPELIRRVKAGDVDAADLVLGGRVARDLSAEDREVLEDAAILDGVKKAFTVAKTLLRDRIV